MFLVVCSHTKRGNHLVEELHEPLKMMRAFFRQQLWSKVCCRLPALGHHITVMLSLQSPCLFPCDHIWIQAHAFIDLLDRADSFEVVGAMGIRLCPGGRSHCVAVWNW